MNLFGSPNIERMAAEHDYDGLHRLLEHRDPMVALQAAQALADLNDGTGWRFLLDTLQGDGDEEARAVAAAMLGELGHPRAVPALKEVLLKLRRTRTAEILEDAVRQALEAINSPEAEEALRGAGYEPVLKGQSHILIEYEPHYARQIVLPAEVPLLSAEQHLNNAVELREAELAERGLVETSLALWLRPDWGYAWYLRGVLFEDLDRSLEALLAYRRARELEPALAEAREALAELEESIDPPDGEPDQLIASLNGRGWDERRDAAAMFGELARRGDPRSGEALETLIARLEDEEREVRHAALEALAALGDSRAIPAILRLRESSWLVRFAILQALAQTGSVSGLVSALRAEMARIQERNPIFSAQKDPLLEVEYEALYELGVRALERAGDLEALLELAEGNAWVEEDEEEEAALPPGGGAAADDQRFSLAYEEELGLTGDEEEDEAEDLSAYVDEVAEMAVIALARLTEARLDSLPEALLSRLSQVPDLTLVDLEEEDDGDADQELVTVRDLSPLRAAAAEALRRRSAGPAGQTG